MKSIQTSLKTFLNFKLNGKEIATNTKKLITDSKSFLDDLAKLPVEEHTFQKVALPIAKKDADFSVQSNNFTFLQEVSPIKEVREASSESEKAIDNYLIEKYLREDIYTILKNVKDREDFKELDKLDQRLVERLLRKFERNGLNLEKDKRKKVEEIRKKISSNEVDFSKNVRDDTTKLHFTKEELEGVSEDFLKSLNKDEKTGKYEITLKYPHIIPLMKYCKVAETRKIVDTTRNSQCMNVNPKIYEETVKLRQEFSKIMGFKDYPEFVLDVRMASDSKTVISFLDDLINRLTEQGKKELKKLEELKREDQKIPKDEKVKIHSYDVTYYNRMLKEKVLDYNEESIKDYFPIENTIKESFAVFQEIFQLIFEEKKDAKVGEDIWHEDVKYYSVYDRLENGKKGKFIGKFYLDLFPRDNKYAHACVCGLQPSSLGDNTRTHAEAAMICNFPKPTEDKPSLLTHDNVNTFYHELGHLIHSVCSLSKYSMFSGTAVERDVVEFPSQMLEGFSYSPEMLKRVSSHYKTGEKLPDDLIEKIRETRTFNKSLWTLRQLFFGKFDIESYYQKDDIVDSQKLFNTLRPQVSLIDAPENTNGCGNFNHLMGGYSVGYYGYLWADVYALDGFSMFEDLALDSKEIKEIGKRYRETVLEVGGTLDGNEIVENFLQRKPNNKAFLKSLGLK